MKNFSVVSACSQDDQRRFALHNRLNEQGVKVGPRKDQATPMTMELREVNYKKLMCKNRTHDKKIPPSPNKNDSIISHLFHMSSFRFSRGNADEIPDSRDE